MDPSSLPCLYMHTGLACGFIEMLLIGIAFYILALLCFYYLCYEISNRHKPQISGPRINILFWGAMILWLVYHGTIRIFPFNFGRQFYYLSNYALDSILFTIPISLVMMTVLEMLFQYQYPGRFKKVMVRLLYVIFLLFYLILGIIVTFVEVDIIAEKYDVMFFWNFCTSLLLVIFIIFPSDRLLRAVSYPIVQPEDVKCVRASKIGLFMFSLIYFGECIYNISIFFGVNYLRNWIQKEIERHHQTTPGPRAFHFMYELVFRLIHSIISILSVHQIRKHDMQFVDDPIYEQDKSESTTSRV